MLSRITKITLSATRLTHFADADDGEFSMDAGRQNHSCAKMGSDERHCNVSLTMRGRVTKSVSINRKLSKREESRSGMRNRTDVLFFFPSFFFFPPRCFSTSTETMWSIRLLGTGQEWDGECEISPTSLFTAVPGVLYFSVSSFRVLYVHRNHMA